MIHWSMQNFNARHLLRLVSLVGLAIFGNAILGSPSGAAPACTITITVSNSQVSGTAGPDVICILADNVVVQALDGDDTVIDEGIANTVYLGDGNDIYDGASADSALINGGIGDDQIDGTPGGDNIYGDSGDDLLSGGDGLDQIWGEAGNDLLSGGAGSNTLNGGPGSNACQLSTTDSSVGCTLTTTLDIGSVQIVAGSISDAAGFPVSGVSITLSNRDGGVASTTTGVAGDFSLLVSRGVWCVELIGYSDPGSPAPSRFSFATTDYTNWLQVTKNVTLDFRLPSIKKIRVHVEDLAGNPILGAVAEYAGSTGPPATVSLGTTLVLSGSSVPLPRNQPSDPSDAQGNLYLYSYFYGLDIYVKYTTSQGLQLSKPVSITDATPRTVSFDTEAFTVSGTVVSSSGFPVSGVSITLSNRDGGVASTTTGVAGDFSLLVSRGVWCVELIGYSDPGSPAPSRFSFATTDYTNWLQVTKNVTLDFRLPSIKKIRVHVEDLAGNPILGAVAEYAGSTGPPATVSLGTTLVLSGSSVPLPRNQPSDPSDAQGNLYLYSYFYGLDIYVKYTTSQGLQLSKPVSITDATPRTVSFDTEAFTVSGTVVSSSGFPVSSVVVTLSNYDGGIASSTSDINGNFSVEVSRGAWRVDLMGSSIAPNSSLVGFSFVTDGTPSEWLQVSKSVTLNFTIPALKRIRVHVEDALGEPIQGATADGADNARLESQALGTGLRFSGWSVPLDRDKISDPSDANGDLFVYSHSYGFNVWVRYTTPSGFVASKLVNLGGFTSAPTSLIASEITERTANLAWLPPRVTWDEPVIDYLVEISRDCTNFVPVKHLALSSPSLKLMGLKPGVAYCVRVAGQNLQGFGQLSDVLRLETLDHLPPRPASLAVSLKQGKYTLAWKAENPADGSPVMNFVVEYSLNGTRWKLLNQWTLTKRSVTLSGLKPKTVYRFRVSSQNNLGLSPVSKVIKFATR